MVGAQTMGSEASGTMASEAGPAARVVLFSLVADERALAANAWAATTSGISLRQEVGRWVARFLPDTPVRQADCIRAEWEILRQILGLPDEQ